MVAALALVAPANGLKPDAAKPRSIVRRQTAGIEPTKPPLSMAKRQRAAVCICMPLASSRKMALQSESDVRTSEMQKYDAPCAASGGRVGGRGGAARRACGRRARWEGVRGSQRRVLL